MRLPLFLFIFLIGITPVLEGIEAENFESYGLPKETPRLITTRWLESDQWALQQWYREQDGFFEPIWSGYLKLNVSSFCSSLLEASQAFPLSRLVRSKYISPEQADILSSLGSRLHPGQFRFYELVRPPTEEEVNNRIFDLSKGDLAFSSFAGGKLNITQATLWTVSGQVTGSHTRMNLVKLPWQLDEEFRSIKLDRAKYPFVWEVGRGVQEQARSLDILLKAASIGMVNEILAYGGGTQDGFLTAHALGEAQSRLFKMRRHPQTGEPVFKVLASHGESNANEVLIARLDDVLAVLPPDTFSRRIADVSKIGGPRLGWRGAVDHIFALRNSVREELDFVHPWASGRGPITFRNTTLIAGWFVALQAARYGIFERGGPEIAKYFSNVRWTDSSLRGPFVLDFSVPPTQEIAKNKLIGLSNLEDEVAKAHPEYTRLILMAAYYYYSEKLRQTYPRERAQILADARFVINSGHDSVLLQARAIPGGEVSRFEQVDWQITANVDGQKATAQPRGLYQFGPGFIFNEKAIRDLILSDPALARQARRALRRGNWQIQYLTSDAIGF